MQSMIHSGSFLMFFVAVCTVKTSEMMRSYDKTIGYSPLEDVDEKKMLQVIRVNKRIIDDYYHPMPEDRLLVAGAGHGREAIIVAGEFRISTFGVDLNIVKIDIPPASMPVSFQRQDISSLGYSDGAFSVIYCYHVLEHVDDHLKVLGELSRVLKTGGVLFIGFPNKHRLISYIGTSQKVTFLDRIKWNFQDYLYRLRGKFENKYGAHAGFSEKEFLASAAGHFSIVHTVRNQYMLCKYARYRTLMNLVIKTGLNEFVFPSNYYICVK
jgi:ubiquinone/menaquinone biosynthesis C-methylase UbiE